MNKYEIFHNQSTLNDLIFITKIQDILSLNITVN